MAERNDWQEPRPPSYIPVPVQPPPQRKNIYDFLNNFWKGCLWIILILFFTPIVILIAPILYNFIVEKIHSLDFEHLACYFDIPAIWLKRYFYGILFGIVLGVIIRLTRRI